MDLIYLSLIIPGILIAFILVGVIYTSWFNWKYPPKPTVYAWRYVYPEYKGEWERGKVTSVYVEQYTNNIRGKVVVQDDGLYLASMWNGHDKEFMFEYEATAWVEEYKPRIYK